MPQIVLTLLLALALPTLAFDGRVVSVVDGDTLTLLDKNNHSTKVRLHGIDAPEKAQAFGQVSKQRLSDLVFGKGVSVDIRGQDKYRRTLGVVLVNGEDINAQMVRDGLAWAYRKYSQDYVTEEAEARAARRGLWAHPVPVPPWDWRKNK